MTREEQIIQASDEWTYQTPPQYSELVYNTHKAMCAYQIGFIDGAVWADAHPHWISVEEELPKADTEVLMVSSGSADTLCGYRCKSVKNRWYCYNDDNYWHNITHWMPMPQRPVLSNSSNIGKDLKGGEV